MRHNKLEMVEVNNTALVEELNNLLELLRIPNEASHLVAQLMSILSNT